MHFIWPELLWLLLLIPLLVVGYIRALRRKRTEVVRYSSLDADSARFGPRAAESAGTFPPLCCCAP
jgi:Ca-activated chloride channel homolog